MSSMSAFSSCSKVGSIMNSPFTRATRTSEMGPLKGMSLTAMAAETRGQGRFGKALLPRRGKRGRSPLHSRRGHTPRRTQDHRDTTHLDRNRLYPRPPRIGRVWRMRGHSSGLSRRHAALRRLLRGSIRAWWSSLQPRQAPSGRSSRLPAASPEASSSAKAAQATTKSSPRAL